MGGLERRSGDAEEENEEQENEDEGTKKMKIKGEERKNKHRQRRPDATQRLVFVGDHAVMKTITPIASVTSSVGCVCVSCGLLPMRKQSKGALAFGPKAREGGSEQVQG